MWVVGELSAPVAGRSCWIELADHVQEHAHLHAFTSWTVTCPIHEFCKWTLMIVPTCGTTGFILVLILVQVSFLLWSVLLSPGPGTLNRGSGGMWTGQTQRDMYRKAGVRRAMCALMQPLQIHSNLQPQCELRIALRGCGVVG